MVDAGARRHDGRMEDRLVDAATADLLVKVGWQAALSGSSVVAGVIGTLLWGRGGRKRLVESTKTLEGDNKGLGKRIAALEAQTRMPAVSQTIDFSAGGDREPDLQSAIAATVHGLQVTIRSLTQHPLGGGHTYAELPAGTNVVTMADGTIRLALPVRPGAVPSARVGGSANVKPPTEG